MKKTIALMTTVVALSSILVGCSKDEQKKENTESSTSNSTQQVDTTPKKENIQIKTTDDILKESRKKVGSDDFGYIEVPQSFTTFKDDKNKDVNSILQWSTPNGYVVITLSKVDLSNSKSKEELKNKTIAEVIADNMITNVKDNVEGTNKKVVETDVNPNIENAFNVRLKNVKSKDANNKDITKSINAYIFSKKDKPDIIYTLLIEGKDDQIDFLSDIIKTWSPTN